MDFQERFKGKVQKMNKEGVIGIIQQSGQPVAKQDYDQYLFTSPQNKYAEQQTIFPNYNYLSGTKSNNNQIFVPQPYQKSGQKNQTLNEYTNIGIPKQQQPLHQIQNNQNDMKPYNKEYTSDYSNQKKLQKHINEQYTNKDEFQIFIKQPYNVNAQVVKQEIRQAPLTNYNDNYTNQFLQIMNNRSHSAQNEQALIMMNNQNTNNNRRLKKNQYSVDRNQEEQSLEWNDQIQMTMPLPQPSINSKYRPYTLREYEDMKKAANVKLGGLGPNLFSDEWQKEKDKVKKRQEFADQVKQFNQGNIVPSLKATNQPIKETNNSRKKALEFAKNIPKPPRRQVEKNTQEPLQMQNQDNEFEKYEKQHLLYLQQIDSMK